MKTVNFICWSIPFNDRLAPVILPCLGNVQTIWDLLQVVWRRMERSMAAVLELETAIRLAGTEARLMGESGQPGIEALLLRLEARRSVLWARWSAFAEMSRELSDARTQARKERDRVKLLPAPREEDGRTRMSLPPDALVCFASGQADLGDPNARRFLMVDLGDRLAPERGVAERALGNSAFARMTTAERFLLMKSAMKNREEGVSVFPAEGDEVTERLRRMVPPRGMPGKICIFGDWEASPPIRNIKVENLTGKLVVTADVLVPRLLKFSPPGRAASADAGSPEDGTAFLTVGVADRSDGNRAGANSTVPPVAVEGGAS